MYLIVDAKTNRIVGSAAKPVDEQECSKNGQKVYEIDDAEYKHSMLGSTIENFQIDGQ